MIEEVDFSVAAKPICPDAIAGSGESVPKRKTCQKQKVNIDYDVTMMLMLTHACRVPDMLSWKLRSAELDLRIVLLVVVMGSKTVILALAHRSERPTAPEIV